MHRRADTLIFGHDMDNNRTEDVRDFTGAAGNRSSFSSDSEHFGRPPSDGGHLTLDDLREAGLTQTFKPRRKMECPHLDSLAGEIIQQQPVRRLFEQTLRPAKDQPATVCSASASALSS